MLDKMQKGALKQLLSSQQWSVLELFAQEICDNIKDTDVIRETEWETLSTTILREGRARGIKEFIAELYKAARDE